MVTQIEIREVPPTAKVLKANKSSTGLTVAQKKLLKRKYRRPRPSGAASAPHGAGKPSARGERRLSDHQERRGFCGRGYGARIPPAKPPPPLRQGSTHAQVVGVRMWPCVRFGG